jgi:hypothetical protein
MASAADVCSIQLTIISTEVWHSPLGDDNLRLSEEAVSPARKENANGQVYGAARSQFAPRCVILVRDFVTLDRMSRSTVSGDNSNSGQYYRFLGPSSGLAGENLDAKLGE